MSAPKGVSAVRRLAGITVDVVCEQEARAFPDTGDVVVRWRLSALGRDVTGDTINQAVDEMAVYLSVWVFDCDVKQLTLHLVTP